MNSSSTNSAEATTSESPTSHTNESLLDQIESLTAQIEADERNQRIQRAVFEIARQSTAAEDMDSFYRSIHEVVSELTSIDAIIIALYHESEQCLSFPYYVDQFDDEQQWEESPLNYRGMLPVEKCKEMLTWRVIKNNEVIRYQADKNSDFSPFGKDCQDWVGIPLRRDGKPIGVFSIQSYEPGFEYSEEEIDLMVFISQHLTSALTHLFDRESLRRANEDLKNSAAKLEEANQQLKNEIEERERIRERVVQLSHQAGKAEIATGILHNIGNVLNSINVSAGLAEETIRTSRVHSLQNVSKLLQEQEDFDTFFSNDPRAKALPAYLIELTDVLCSEHEKIKDELATLASHLDHVKTVVSMQQTYAGMTGLKESVSLPNLFDDAELLLASSLDRHRVEIVREFEPMPKVMLEKQKLLQVIVNLLKNAKDSMTAGREKGRRLDIRVARIPDDVIRIDLVDNGVGIEPENITNIFSHGFTTKSEGHGFGLHSCANAMREMNGELFAASEGRGKGATFTLKLPFVLATNQ